MSSKQKYEYAISACLVGVRCRWDGRAKPDKKALSIFKRGRCILICPEVSAGLPTPRPACEIIGGDGSGVLAGRARVISRRRKDFTKFFVKGAQLTYLELKEYGVRKVILKSGSPSCGVNRIYSGKFDGQKKKGSGVFVSLLAKKGIITQEI
jgi:uncharacterized protein YbbK (DUF523 family)